MNIHVRAGRRVAGVAAALIAALAVGGGVVPVADREPVTPAVAAAPSTPPPPARPRIPLEIARDSLTAQAAALLAGNEKGWLAVVDPAQPRLLTRYRTLYASLRGLGVTSLTYEVFPVTTTKPTPGRLAITARLRYCLAGNECGGTLDFPLLHQELTLRRAGAGYVIAAEAHPEIFKAADQEPVPFEAGGKLVFARGRRVTVIAPPAQAGHLRQVLALAEKSAVIADRFAAMLGTKQPRYRVYLAGAKQWRTWYGGGQRGTTVGYAIRLRETGTDVVLNMPELAGDHSLLTHTIQHELGHAVTVGGPITGGASGDMWLKEGIAEYIGWYPRTALDSWRRPAVHRAVGNGRQPHSIAVAAMPDGANRDESDTYYGFAHFAADCMGRKYGQRPLLVFVDQYLRQGKDLDVAARKAFGKPFAAVDKTCVAWIRDHA